MMTELPEVVGCIFPEIYPCVRLYPIGGRKSPDCKFCNDIYQATLKVIGFRLQSKLENIPPFHQFPTLENMLEHFVETLIGGRMPGEESEIDQKSRCPYPEYIPDEASGILILNPKWIAWHEGFNKGFQEGQLAIILRKEVKE